MAGVTFQATPNPNAGKFVADRVLTEGRSRSFYDVAQAASDPVAAALFGLPGVVSLFMVNDFVTVTKEPDVAWPDLIARVTEAMERVLAG